jgi:hypothetical protein
MKSTVTFLLLTTLQLAALAATETSITSITQEQDAVVIHYQLTGFSLEDQDGKARIEIAGMELSSYAGQPQLPFTTFWLEIPVDAEVTLELQEQQTSFYPALDLAMYQDDEVKVDAAAGRTNLDSFAALGNEGWMRDLRLVPLTLQPVRIEEEGVRVLQSAAVRVSFSSATKYSNISYSSEMDELYRSFIVNHRQFSDHRDETEFPRMLVVSSPFYSSYIDGLLQWKRRAGFDVDYVTFDQMPGGGNTMTADALDSWVTDYYAMYQPEYIILVGDQDGTYACPTFLIPESEGENYNVTDLQYSLKVGDDYLPDLLLGRLSVHDAPVQLLTIIDKIIKYESEPFPGVNEEQEDWLESSLVVGGNYAEGASTPVTPVLTSRWVRERMLDNGYSQVDTVYYPPNISGEPMISNAINNGVGIVNYRGWADAEHWQRPSYSITDMNTSLNNHYMTPIMLSIVCNTGDFGHATEPCFAEAFLRLGSPGQPKGGVAVLAPSDLHTRSIYNNAINAGFYRGLFNQGITTMGGNVVRAKIDLFNGFPNEQEINGYVFFYFNVYNLLGDPSLRLRTAVPEPLLVTASDTLAIGSTSYTVAITDEQSSPVGDLLVTLVAGDDNEQLLARGQTDAGGNLTLFFDRLEDVGTAKLTVVGYNSYPHLVDIPIVVRPQYAAIIASEWREDGTAGSTGNGDALINPGETVAWFPTLLNSGSETIPSINLTATVDDEFLVLQSSELTFGELLSGNQTTSATPLLLDVSHSALHGWPLQLNLQISGEGFAQDSRDEQTAVGSRTYYASHTLLEDANQMIDPEETVQLQLTLANDGALPTADLSGTLLIAIPELTVIDTAPQSIGVIPVAGEATVTFELQGEIDILPGLLLPLQLELTGAGDFQQLLGIDITNGHRETGDPTGPDGYGYWAYESRDYYYLNRPSYEWLEIDSRLGGDGTRLWLDDDQSATIALPFFFPYYGVAFDTVTVCSNGWLSMGRTWMSDFTNWMIPPGLGPSNMIMPFWDDLKPQYTAEEDSVWVPVFYKDMGDGRFVVEWSQTYNRYLWDSDAMEETFQVILYDPAQYPTETGDGQILFQYRVIADEDARANYATVGITDHDHFHGLEVTFAQRYGPDAVMLADRTAILITTEQPQRVTEPQIILEGDVDWIYSVTPELEWNPGPLAGDPDVTYTLELALDELFTQPVASYTDITSILYTIPDPLEEITLYFWRVTAHQDGEDVPCAPDYLSFQIDATPPVAEIGLIDNPVFPHYLDLGIVTSEELALSPWIVVTATDSSLIDSSQATQLPQTGTGFHYALNLELLGQYQLGLQMVDAHGLPGSADRDLALGGAGYTAIEIGDDVRLDWLAGAVVTALEVEEGVELTGDGSYRLEFSGEGVICRFENGQWRALAPEGVKQIVIHEGGHYAQRSAGDLLPDAVTLYDNYPNPFNGSTRLEFTLPERAAIQLSVYNLLGRQVEVLQETTLSAGYHLLDWQPTDYASGMYWAVLRVEGETVRVTRTQKMLYLK